MHQLSRGASQNPFRKNRGRVVRVLFHPSKPFFFVATQQNVRSWGGRLGVHCRCWGAAAVGPSATEQRRHGLWSYGQAFARWLKPVN